MIANPLCSSCRRKGFTLHNRLGVTPKSHMSAPGDSIPPQDVLVILARRVEYGAALVSTDANVASTAMPLS